MRALTLAALSFALSVLLVPVTASFGRKEGLLVPLADESASAHLRLHRHVPWPPSGAPWAVTTPRIFCFAVLMPTVKETGLIAPLQQSFAACDGSAIISNVSSVLVRGQDGRETEYDTIRAIHGPMDVNSGGEWKTALNTGIFNQVYRHLFSEAMWAALRFDSYDWIIKLDADTVLVPQRLRVMLATRSPLAPVLLCAHGGLVPVPILDADTRQPRPRAEQVGPHGLGMQTHVAAADGPLMPFSIAAWRWLRRTYTEVCVPGVRDWKGQMGEDWFMGECCKLVSIPLVFEPAMLISKVLDVEDQCNNWQIVAFHGPLFKSTADGQANRDLCLRWSEQASTERVRRRSQQLAKLKAKLSAASMVGVPDAKLLPLYSRSSNRYGLWFSHNHPMSGPITSATALREHG